MTDSSKPDPKTSGNDVANKESSAGPDALTDEQTDAVTGGLGDIVVNKTTDKASLPP